MTHGISPLRQRMIDDMRMRKLSPKTQSVCIRHVRRLAAFLGRSPDTATGEDLRLFQLHRMTRPRSGQSNMHLAKVCPGASPYQARFQGIDLFHGEKRTCAPLIISEAAPKRFPLEGRRSLGRDEEREPEKLLLKHGQAS